MELLRTIDPKNQELVTLTPPDCTPSNADIERVQAACEAASIDRVRNYVMPNGVPIGERGDKATIRVFPNAGFAEAQKVFDHLSAGGQTIVVQGYRGTLVQLPGKAGFLGLRPVSFTPGLPSIDLNVPGVPYTKDVTGAADIPVTRLLGQSPAGLSATGDSDTRNYYDMISARQELDLRPRLERLDALVLRSAGVEPEAASFAFRPLRQLSGAERASVALQKAQASAVYAGPGLWPSGVMAALVRAQVLEDGTYPGAEGVFAGVAAQTSPDGA